MRKYFYCIVFSLLCCLFYSCGLEEYYALEAPFRTEHRPNYENTDFQNNYFDFYTNESQNATISSSFKFLGTAVYYKIYKKYEDANNDISSINNLNNSTTYSAAANSLIESYKYQPLATENSLPIPLISAEGTDRRIYIRLSNYQTTNYKAGVVVDYNGSNPPPTNLNTYTPMRNVSRRKQLSFDFGSDADSRPQAGDIDYKDADKFSTGYENTYFVNLYAISTGRDTTYTTYYSKVLYLGTVPINSAETNN